VFGHMTRAFVRYSVGLSVTIVILLAPGVVCHSQDAALRRVVVFEGEGGLKVYVGRHPSLDLALVMVSGAANSAWDQRVFRCRVIDSGAGVKTFVTSAEEDHGTSEYFANNPQHGAQMAKFAANMNTIMTHLATGHASPGESQWLANPKNAELMHATLGQNMGGVAQILGELRREVLVDDREWELLEVSGGQGHLRLREAANRDYLNAYRAQRAHVLAADMNTIMTHLVTGHASPGESQWLSNRKNTATMLAVQGMNLNEIAEVQDRLRHDSTCQVSSCKYYFHNGRAIQYSPSQSKQAEGRLDEYQRQH